MKKTAYLFLAYLLVLTPFITGLLVYSEENRVVIEDGKVSSMIPDKWQRGVPQKGYSLLLGVLEPDTKMRANISLMITNIPGLSNQKFTLDDLFQSSKANLDKTFPSYTNLTKLSMTVLKNEILAIKYDIPQEDVSLSCKQYYIFDGDDRYLFTGVSSKKNFASYEIHFDNIVQSIKINH